MIVITLNANDSNTLIKRQMSLGYYLKYPNISQ